jgi:hypothetical protein
LPLLPPSRFGDPILGWPQPRGAKFRAQLHRPVRPQTALGRAALACLFRDHKSPDWCCSADTAPASLSIASTIRPTKGRHACFVNVWPMLIVRKRSPAVGPGAFPDPPPRAWGPRRFSTAEPGPVLRAGPDVDTRPKSPRGIAKGTEVACGTSSPRRTARGSNYARLIRHSVGQKVANNWNIAEMPQFAHYDRNAPTSAASAAVSRERSAWSRRATKPGRNGRGRRQGR